MNRVVMNLEDLLQALEEAAREGIVTERRGATVDNTAIGIAGAKFVELVRAELISLDVR